MEVPLEANEFDQMWRVAKGRILRKVRTSYGVRDASGHVYGVSIDSFTGMLEGLTLAEVEFQSWGESIHFRVPDFFGDEVTHDRRYRNAFLASLQAPPYP